MSNVFCSFITLNQKKLTLIFNLHLWFPPKYQGHQYIQKYDDWQSQYLQKAEQK